jgi:DNA topoisomerase-3
LVQVGEDTSAIEASAQEGQTRPPRPHDDASLLLAMETAGKALDDRELARAMRSSGLGTPATRAAILQTLVERTYVVREGRTLRSTERGRALIEVLPVEELKSAELTGRWEARLTAIAEGRDARGGFMHDVGEHVREVVDAIRGAQLAAVMSESKPSAALGPCPMCPGTVRERGNAWRCDGGCGFVIWGSVAKRKISPTLAKELLRDKKTKAVKGFKSKAGAEFEAGLELQPDGKVTFWFPPREEGAPRGEPSGRGARAASPRDDEAPRRAAAPRDGGEEAPRRAAPARSRAARPEKPAARGAKPATARATSAMPDVAPAAPPRPEGAPCPLCGEGRVIRGRAAWGCDRWQQGCGWRLSFVGDDGAPRSSDEVRAALARGRR